MSARPRLTTVVVLVGLLWVVAYPLVLVSMESVRVGGQWTLAPLRQFTERPGEWAALWASVWISVVSVVLSAAIGVPLAFLFSRFDFPGRRFLGSVVALPAVLPPLVGVIAFLFLYGETGFAARFVQAILRTDDAPWRLQGPGAVLLVHAYSMYVYFYLLVRAGLDSIDPALLEAAASLGAGRARTIRRVLLPLLRPALAGAALLTFMTALASFSAPYIFGGGFRVMTTQILSTRLNGDYAMAMVETLSLTVVALLALWVIRRVDAGRPLAGGSKGVAPARYRIGGTGARRLVVGASWGLAILLLLPHLTLFLLSFVPSGTWTVETFPPAYSLQNYGALLSEPERLRPLINSVWMATAATAGGMALSVLAALLVARRRSRVGGLIEGLLALPWAVPGTVFAIALATTFSVYAPLAGRFVLIGTVALLPLAYLVRNLPITSRPVFAGFRGLDHSLEEAAASLGAGSWRTLRRVTLPLLAPALSAGATLAFVTALGDFVTSIVLYTYDTRPLSLEILSSLRQGDVGVSAAYGVLLMVISAAAFALGRERGVAA